MSKIEDSYEDGLSRVPNSVLYGTDDMNRNIYENNYKIKETIYKETIDKANNC